MAVSSEVFAAANERGRRATSEYGARQVGYDARSGAIRVILENGQVLVISKRAVGELQDATDMQLQDVRITPSRLGLHFALLDVDLSIPNLIHSEDGRAIRLVREPR